MIVISKTISVSNLYDITKIAPLKEILFFDIETTGLSQNNAMVYLIGAAYYEQMEWHLRQWYADSFSSEQDIIRDFFLFLQNYRVLVSFHGDGFAIPFLKKSAAQYQLDTLFPELESLDLLKKAKNFKDLLGLEHLRQRDLEAFLGVFRSDPTEGKDLIPVYQHYLETHDQEDYQRLLSHNEADVRGLLQLIPILSYQDIFQSDWTLAGYSLNTAEQRLTAVLDCAIRVPVSVQIETELYAYSIRANQIFIELPVFQGELKYFFDHYSDYYYLPAEDQAVHKKVAAYVDKDHRVQASASTCYTRKSSIFLPLTTEDMFPVFKSDFRSKELYTEYQEDPEFLLAYFRSLLQA